MNRKSRKKYFIPLFFVLLMVYLFWGPLFPWSPVKPGFKKIKSSGATLFYTDFDEKAFPYNLDKILREEEQFHNLTYQKYFRIIVPGKESNMKRYLPWMKGSGYSVSLGFANVVYIGSNARNSPYGLEAYLKHELSHLLIQQNTPTKSDHFEIQKQAWLSEGIATHFGGPHYYDRLEFAGLWRERGHTFDDLFMKNPLEMDKSMIRLYYSYYRFFVEFLIETCGLEKLQEYLRNYCKDPASYLHIFRKVYHAELNQKLAEFNNYMNTAGYSSAYSYTLKQETS